MPRYVIAFHSPGKACIQKLIELETKGAALRFFFQNHIDEVYTKDEDGFTYFEEDFNDPEEPLGSIIEV